jgi:putative ATPase
VIASAGAEIIERIGMPEGRIPLAEVTIYLATAPKSNRAYLAINKALADLESRPVPPVPAPLRSSGAVGYAYPHDDPRGIVRQKYSELSEKLYEPSKHGFEKTIAERLRAIGEILEG